MLNCTAISVKNIFKTHYKYTVLKNLQNSISTVTSPNKHKKTSKPSK